MAENPVASRPRFFLDEEKNQEFLKTLENGRGGTTRRVHVPPQEERQNAAAVIEAVVDDEEEEDMEVLFSTSTSAPPTQNPKRSSLGVNSEKLASKETLSTIKPLTSWWSRIQDGWLGVEDKLVQWFGLDQSKYQWAIDEYMDRQLNGDNQKPTVHAEELQLQQRQEQVMQRNEDLPLFVPPQKQPDVSK
ncbi:unnamed protein product [Sphagnum jensenii]|uniref:Uncharacterized protein n=1 Tax=Sphagnum jensenii TaxID=128206 RepID=A0ABP0XKD1_9BRYO